MNHLAHTQIEVQPIIRYPRQAEPGKTYLMSIDLRAQVDMAGWPYEEEEYPIYCMVDTAPLFTNQPLGEPAVVLHRFGGTYGPAMFLLTAVQEEMEGSIRITLVNGWGVPVDVIELADVRIRREATGIPVAKQASLERHTVTDADVQAGITAYNLGDYTRALAFFDRAVDTLKDVGQSSPADEIYFDLNIPIVRGWLELEGTEARREFLRARRQEITDETVQEMKAAVSQRLRQDPRDVMGLAESMLFAASLTDEPMHRAWGLMAKGNVQRFLGEYEAAIATYDEARRICLAQDQLTEAARPHMAKVYALASLGRFDEALQTAEEARQVFTEYGDIVTAGIVDQQAGITAYKLGDYSRALALFDRAADTLRDAEQAKPADAIYIDLNRSIVELDRSVVLRNLDRFSEAKRAAMRARRMAAKQGMSVNVARADQSLAITQYFLGRYNEALKLFDQARQVFASSGLRREVLVANLFATNCHLALNRYAEALDLAQEAEREMAGLGMQYEVAWAAYNRAQAYMGLGQVEAAADALTRARLGFAQIENQVWVATVDIQWAILNLKIGALEAALANARRASQVFAEEGLAVEGAQADLVAAEAMVALGRNDEARLLCLSALQAASDRDVPWLANQARHLLGRLAEIAGDQQAALEHYQACASGVERLRRHVAFELRGSFLADKGEIYEDVVSLRLARAEIAPAFDYVERAKSRALVELLSHHLDIRVKVRRESDRDLVAHVERLRQECQWYYSRLNPFGEREGAESGPPQTERERLQDELDSREKQLADMLVQLQVHNADYIQDADLWQVQVQSPQPYLDDDTLLLEYFIARSEVLAFSVTREEIQVHRRLATLSHLNQLLGLLHLNLHRFSPTLLSRGDLSGGELANLQGLLGRLYAMLIHPLADRLTPFKRLVIVPHGPLHYLPFHTLFDGRHYLLERSEIAYLPNSSLLRLQLDKGNRNDDSSFALLVACSLDGALPHTLVEAQQVASRLSGTSLLEEEATRANLEAEAGAARVIHLATHAEFRPDAPLFSTLYLADGPLATIDIFNLELRASLVTLSACQSGASAMGGGDELVALSRAFLYAGASSLLISLWRVEDQATARLMDRFYQALLDGQHKPAALRQSQLALLRGEEGEHYRHPYFWAPFILIGGRGRVFEPGPLSLSASGEGR
jgi:tetratricopeptide (TPR) repeat protein